MDWLTEAHAELLGLLSSPRAIAEREAADDLRQAGVSEVRIAALYPPDPFDHIIPLSILLRSAEFMRQVAQPAKKIALPVLVGFLPGQASQELSMLIENTWSPDGVERYRMVLAGRKSDALTLFPDGGAHTIDEQIERGEVVRTLLSLPRALDAFLRAQLDPAPWRGDTRLHFHHFLDKAKPEIISVIEAIRDHQPVPQEPDIEGIIAYLASES